MSEAAATTIERPKRLRFDWIPGVFFFPRKTFKEITSQNQAVWLVPILILTLTTILTVIAAGPIKKMNAQMVVYPEESQWWTPEQYAQYDKAQQNYQKPVFIYIFPALIASAKVWAGWLLVGALLHLFMTMFGGRGSASMSMNVVAWAGLPFALRDIIQTILMFNNKTLIAGQGLSGFVSGETGFPIFLSALLAGVDLYLIWHLLLVVTGVRASGGITLPKAWLSVLITIFLVLAVYALITFLTSLLSGQSFSGYIPFF